MGIWGKAKKASQPAGVQLAEQHHDLDQPGWWVNWVSYCQDQLQAVAQQINWEPGEQASAPVVLQIIPDKKAPRNPNGCRVQIGGYTVGYTPRSDQGQKPGQSVGVLVKQGRDILVWVAA